MLSIEVEDDGQGIRSQRDKLGHGIDNMKTRSRLISARFEIGSHAGGLGTSVKVTLPVVQKRLAEVSS